MANPVALVEGISAGQLSAGCEGAVQASATVQLSAAEVTDQIELVAGGLIEKDERVLCQLQPQKWHSMSAAQSVVYCHVSATFCTGVKGCRLCTRQPSAPYCATDGKCFLNATVLKCFLVLLLWAAQAVHSSAGGHSGLSHRGC